MYDTTKAHFHVLQVGKILKRKAEILAAYDSQSCAPSAKRPCIMSTKKSFQGEVDDAVWQRFTCIIALGVAVSGPVIQEKPSVLPKSLPLRTLKHPRGGLAASKTVTAYGG